MLEGFKIANDDDLAAGEHRHGLGLAQGHGQFIGGRKAADAPFAGGGLDGNFQQPRAAGVAQVGVASQEQHHGHRLQVGPGEAREQFF